MFTYPFHMLYLNLSTIKTLFLIISVIVSIILLFNYSLFQENTSHDNLFIESNKFIKDKQTEVSINVDRLSYNIFTNPSSQNISPEFVPEVAEERSSEEAISSRNDRKYSNIINQKLAKKENNMAKIKREIEKRRTKIKETYPKFTTNPLASIEINHENLESKKILNVSNISYNRRSNENTKEFFSYDDEFYEKEFHHESNNFQSKDLNIFDLNKRNASKNDHNNKKTGKIQEETKDGFLLDLQEGTIFSDKDILIQTEYLNDNDCKNSSCTLRIENMKKNYNLIHKLNRNKEGIFINTKISTPVENKKNYIINNRSLLTNKTSFVDLESREKVIYNKTSNLSEKNKSNTNIFYVEKDIIGENILNISNGSSTIDYNNLQNQNNYTSNILTEETTLMSNLNNTIWGVSMENKSDNYSDLIQSSEFLENSTIVTPNSTNSLIPQENDEWSNTEDVIISEYYTKDQNLIYIVADSNEVKNNFPENITENKTAQIFSNSKENGGINNPSLFNVGNKVESRTLGYEEPLDSTDTKKLNSSKSISSELKLSDVLIDPLGSKQDNKEDLNKLVRYEIAIIKEEESEPIIKTVLQEGIDLAGNIGGKLIDQAGNKADLAQNLAKNIISKTIDTPEKNIIDNPIVHNSNKKQKSRIKSQVDIKQNTMHTKSKNLRNMNTKDGNKEIDLLNSKTSKVTENEMKNSAFKPKSSKATKKRTPYSKENFHHDDVSNKKNARQNIKRILESDGIAEFLKSKITEVLMDFWKPLAFATLSISFLIFTLIIKKYCF